MKASNNGMIVNMSSAANISGYEDLSVYSASKAALSSLTDSVAKETKDLNIKAVAIMPSRTNTPMQVAVRGKEVAKSSQSPDFVASIIAKIVNGEIVVQNGDDVRIREGRFVVEEDVFTKKILKVGTYVPTNHPYKI
jgi:short-subunit dehydrogenase